MTIRSRVDALISTLLGAVLGSDPSAAAVLRSIPPEGPRGAAGERGGVVGEGGGRTVDGHVRLGAGGGDGAGAEAVLPVARERAEEGERDVRVPAEEGQGEAAVAEAGRRPVGPGGER
ncbi:hypothetical protein BIV57_08420 [Mangrovactinospora gilvigrisea]|uniref:Uncharacterized protein n=1 Tax=Mangrovactinospora gilvigrisea TaxID=1428644 RepID=A0A1J7C8U1_9ACTN|nr:hypothetical protein [Mangrovactinospora gilvigrisea]OIV37952.1 hypothetical protein BIV57_08420 [Mangrovactinospora gilvigrisea]